MCAAIIQHITHTCARSIAGVPSGRFRATPLLRTTRMRSGRAAGGGAWARGKRRGLDPRQRRGFSPGAAARHRTWTRVPRILSFSGVLFLSGVLFPLLFFTFSEIRLHCRRSLCTCSSAAGARRGFIVRSQIGGELARGNAIFGIATPWGRGKPCPISKKVGGKRRNCDVRSQKNQGCPISGRKRPRSRRVPLVFSCYLSDFLVPLNPDTANPGHTELAVWLFT